MLGVELHKYYFHTCKIVMGNILPQISNIRKYLCVALDRQAFRIQWLGKWSMYVNSKGLLPTRLHSAKASVARNTLILSRLEYFNF